MITIFVMYSPDRVLQFEQMNRINSRMNGWSSAEKLLLVDWKDGVELPDFPGWRTIPVPRPRTNFNWSSMWEHGVEASSNEAMLYLDSDRALPRNYLEEVISVVNDNRFVFSETLFGMNRTVDDEVIIDLLDNHDPESIRIQFDDLNRKFSDLIYYDPRYRLPLHGPGKGVMSGNTGFTRSGYRRSGGVDPWFEGHGAYADTDFQKQVWNKGFEFVPIDATEIHIWHPKFSDQSSEELTQRDIEVLSLNNFIYHARKWKLGYHYPQAIANYLGLGDSFVERVLERIQSDDPFEPIWY